jgi:hypothetical protein
MPRARSISASTSVSFSWASMRLHGRDSRPRHTITGFAGKLELGIYKLRVFLTLSNIHWFLDSLFDSLTMVACPSYRVETRLVDRKSG